ncbi:hypothetical protein [Coralliovum pocilloporae]|uniref:hypothetical protein n=1 Tax=Coralliovum pocilloporae TaxID=3066369 RepID=UPI0033076EA7
MHIKHIIFHLLQAYTVLIASLALMAPILTSDLEIAPLSLKETLEIRTVEPDKGIRGYKIRAWTS